MTQPSIDRIQSVWLLVVETAVLTTGRVPPVVTLNSHRESDASILASPSVINMIGTVDQSGSGECGYSTAAEPIRQNVAQANPKDWTTSRPEPQKVQDPPPEPLSKMLIEQIKSLWQASAGAMQVQLKTRSTRPRAHQT